MKLFMYGLKDNVQGEFIFVLQEKNEGMMKRIVKGCLLDKSGQNPFCHDLKDKDIYELGTFDTFTGKVTPHAPIFITSVQELRLELIREIKLMKAESGEEKPEADEVVSDEQ